MGTDDELNWENEENWLRHRVVRMRTVLRFAKDPRVVSGLKELIGEAEDRLELLQARLKLDAPRSQ